MVGSFKDKLVDILVNGKLLDQKQLDKALEIQKKTGGSLSKILVDGGFISQKTLMIVLSHQLNIPPINLTKYRIDPAVVNLIPEKLARQYIVIPISKVGNVLTLAMPDPLNLFAIDDLKALTNFTIEPVIATEDDIKEALNSAFGTTTAEQDITKVLEEAETGGEEVEVLEDEKFDVSEVSEESKSAPIVKVVSLILNEALKKRASDIHIESREKACGCATASTARCTTSCRSPKRTRTLSSRA